MFLSCCARFLKHWRRLYMGLLATGMDLLNPRVTWICAHYLVWKQSDLQVDYIFCFNC